MAKYIIQTFRPILIAFFFLTLFRCSSNEPASKSIGIIYQDSCQIEGAKQVEFRQVKSFDKQYVSIEGFYRHDFEMSALFHDEKENALANGLWVDFNYSKLTNPKTKKELVDPDFTEMSKIYDKRVRIVGFIDLNSKGHLDNYIGEIQKICYVEILK